MKKITLLTFAIALAFAVVGCETTKETNSNHAVVTNANNMNATVINANVANTNNVTGTGTINFNSNISRADYDKDKDKYESAAKSAGATIGTGADDLWLWTKTRSALATTDDLRDSTINVDVDNGVITLKGTVATKAQLDSAVKVANGIEGKKSVKNELKVSATDSVMDMDDKNDKSNSNANTKK